MWMMHRLVSLTMIGLTIKMNEQELSILLLFECANLAKIDIAYL